MSEQNITENYMVGERAEQAKALYKDTAEWKEYEERSKDWTEQDTENVNEGILALFKEFGEIKGQDPASEEAQMQVKKLQDFITTHLYTCSDEILSGLGKMYGAGGEFTENIDRTGGEGTAFFVRDAIRIFCKES